MIGELFFAHDMPEPPKESFFKGLFGGGARSLDREELCEYITRFCFFHIYFYVSLCARDIDASWLRRRIVLEGTLINISL